MEVFEAIRKRRSIRKYFDKQVEEEKIMKILEAARWAPSARNTQPWQFIVVKDKERRKELAKIAYNQKFIEEAPVIIVVCGEKAENLVNIGLAMQNICLEAFELGLGSCIVGWFDKEKAREFLKVPDEYDVCYLIPIGYPAEIGVSSRRELKEIIHREEW